MDIAKGAGSLGVLWSHSYDEQGVVYGTSPATSADGEYVMFLPVIITWFVSRNSVNGLGDLIADRTMNRIEVLTISIRLLRWIPTERFM